MRTIFAVALLSVVVLSEVALAHPKIQGPARADVMQFMMRQPDRFLTRLIDAELIYGDFTGDGQNDVVGFFSAPFEDGNAIELRVFSFRNESGKYVFNRAHQDASGMERRNVEFAPGRMSYTTLVVGPNDARCCPSTVRRFVLDMGHVAAPSQHVSPAADEGNPAKLDRFLAGITRCRFTPEFRRFHQGLIGRFGNVSGALSPQVNAAAAVPLPTAYEAAFDMQRASSRLSEDRTATIVTVPVTGSFNGLRLRHLEFLLGNENGWNHVAYIFDETPQRVLNALKKHVDSGNAALRREPYGGSVGFGRPAQSVWCDTST